MARWNYDPKDALDHLEAAEYDAELTRVEECVSKAGNPMLALEWTVPWCGKNWVVKDWIVNPATLWKLKAIAKAWQMLMEFESRTFDLSEHKGKLARLNLAVKHDDKYGDKNEVRGYGEPRDEPAPAPVVHDEDIPF